MYNEGCNRDRCPVFRAENHFPAPERKDHEKTYQPPHVRPQVASGLYVWFQNELENAKRRYPVVILFQVRDLAAKTCGEPHVAPSWEVAKASLGAMLAKTPELAERANAIRIEYVCEWDPSMGCDLPLFNTDGTPPASDGSLCLAEFRAACAKEENDVQAAAEDPKFYHKNVVTGDCDEIPLTADERNHQIMLEHASKEDEDE